MAEPTAGLSALAALFDDLVRCETRIYNALSEQLRKEHGLVVPQFTVLRYLRDHPNARVADVARHFAIGIGATSKAIDRHERDGWVSRIPNPEDRRSSLLVLTPAGAQAVAEAEPTFETGLRELIESGIAPSRLPEVATALSDLRNTLEREQIGTPPG